MTVQGFVNTMRGEGYLAAAIAQTGATLAFDAIGGGRMANDILVAMEQAQIQLGAARCSRSSIKRTTKRIKLRMGPQDAKGVPPRNLERFCPRHSCPHCDIGAFEVQP